MPKTSWRAPHSKNASHPTCEKISMKVRDPQFGRGREKGKGSELRRSLATHSLAH